MSGVLRHYQSPEWSARALWDFAQSVLAKTHEYNPSADDWRLIRTEDVPGGTANLWVNPRAVGVWPAWADMTPAVGGFRVPQGIGMGFYGFWYTGADMGFNAAYRLLVNSVQRIIYPMHEFMADSKGANKLLDSGTSGVIFWFHVKAVHLEQLVFCRENDVVQYQLTGTTAVAVWDIEFFPQIIIAGNSKQLLTNA